MLKNSPDRRRVPPPPEQPISQQRPNISKSIASVALQDHFSSILSLDSLQRASRISFHHSPAVPKKVLPLHAQLVKKSEKQAKLAAQKQERRRRQLPEVKVVELLGLDEEERVLVDDLYGNSSANPRKIKQTLAEKYGLIPTANSARKLSSDEWEKLKEASGDRGDQLICPICQDEFKAEDQVLLSCSHTFHRRCLESYERYVNRKACPL